MIIKMSKRSKLYETSPLNMPGIKTKIKHNDGFLVSGKKYYEGILNFLAEYIY